MYQLVVFSLCWWWLILMDNQDDRDVGFHVCIENPDTTDRCIDVSDALRKNMLHIWMKWAILKKKNNWFSSPFLFSLSLTWYKVVRVIRLKSENGKIRVTPHSSSSTTFLDSRISLVSLVVLLFKNTSPIIFLSILHAMSSGWPDEINEKSPKVS